MDQFLQAKKFDLKKFKVNITVKEFNWNKKPNKRMLFFILL